jgi:integrase
MKALTTIMQDTRREKKEQTYPVKIRVTFLRKQVYYPTRFDLTEEDFNKLFTPKPREEFKKILLELTGIENKAKDIIDELKGNFTWSAFNAKFLKKRSDWDSVFSNYKDYIKKLRGDDRISTAISYECSLSSLKAYIEKKAPKKGAVNSQKAELTPKASNKKTTSLSFEEISVEFLTKYEKWMLQNDRSITTVGIYLRALRAIFNEAIGAGIVSKDVYPFGVKKYEIPTGKNIKKALDIETVGKLYHHQPESEAEAKARDYWLLSYFGNGMNMKDIALLKYKDRQDDFIIFERAKTKRSRRKAPTIITVPLTDDIKIIINKWGNKNQDPDNYIFPILEKGLTAERIWELIHQFVKTTNKYTRRIASTLEINKDITTYVARHSFSTVLKRSGASTEFISEALGHADPKTTRNYLDSFEDDHKMEMAKALTAFKKKNDIPDL